MTHPGRLRRHGFKGDRSGSAAVEFAILIAPLLFVIFGILEVSLHYFVSASVDFATQKLARFVKTGQAQALTMNTAQLKSQMCQDMLNLFDCTTHSYITVEVLTTLSAPPKSLPVNAAGTFIADVSPQLGAGGSYVIVHTYFQFSPLFDIFGALTPRLANGNHIVVASALFRNEPF
jgi:Flp pilus assembly protein TadG